MAEININNGPQDEEMVEVFNFMKKYKNAIVAVIVIIGLGILGFNWYQAAKIDGEKDAAQHLFAVKKLYTNRDYEGAIKTGLENYELASSYSQGGDILLFIAKAYIATGKTDEALATAEKCLSKYKSDEIIRYSATFMIAGIYMDKYVTTKDNANAEKAAMYYVEGSKIQDGAYETICLFKAADAYKLIGKKDLAKKTIEPLFLKSSELKYPYNSKVKDFYNSL